MFLARSDDFSRLGAETTEVVTTDSKSFSEKLYYGKFTGGLKSGQDGLRFHEDQENKSVTDMAVLTTFAG
jgi:hypothetical protein